MTEGTVLYAFVVVAGAIVLDTLLGAINAIVKMDEDFDLRQLPRFLASGILPYIGGLAILATAAEVIRAEFEVLFFAAAAAVTAKYLAEIKDKISALFGADIKAKG